MLYFEIRITSYNVCYTKLLRSSCVSIPSVNLPGAISGGTTTGIWSSSGDGSFSPDPTQLLASYLPGSTDTSIRTVTLKLTATATGACPVSADSLVLTLTVV